MYNNEELGTISTSENETLSSATILSNKRAFITKYWTLAVIAILMSAVIALSSVLIVVLKNKDNGEPLFDDDSYKQQRQEAYSQTKTLLQEAIVNNSLPSVVGPRIDNTQEQEILSKYDSKFFDDYIALLDNNAEIEDINDFLLGFFGEYEHSLVVTAFEKIIIEWGLDSNQEIMQSRGRLRIGVYFKILRSQIPGWLAGKAFLAIPKIAAFIGSFSWIVGFFIGVAIGSIIAGIIDPIARAWIRANGQRDSQINLSANVINWNGWLIPNWQVDIDLMPIIDIIF